MAIGLVTRRNLARNLGREIRRVECLDRRSVTARISPRTSSRFSQIVGRGRCHQPRGAWPFSFAEEYAEDQAHMKEYMKLAATAEGGVNTLYWFANDSFVTAGRPGIALPWKPAQPGRYLLRVVDEHGRADSREVVVTAAP